MGIKKGFFFSTDALIALFVLVFAISSVSLVYINDKPDKQVYFFSQDISNILASNKVSDINNSYLNSLIQNKSIKDKNTPIIEQIGMFWAKDETTTAKRLAKEIITPLAPPGYGVSVKINNNILYSNNKTPGEELISHKSLITGIESGKPLNGTSARIYFSSLGKHKRSRYAYFGGFVGQGELSRFIKNIPKDAKITRMSLQLSAGDNFSLFINQEKCDDFITEKKNMQPGNWNISQCNSSIVLGKQNNFTIKFKNKQIDDDYIAGGYISIDYFTDEIYSKGKNSSKYFLPEINGMANLYSSVYFPENLSSMRIHLHFKSNYTTYMTIGDRVIFNMTANGSETTQEISNKTLTSFPNLLDYESLSNSTVPIRFASFNTTRKKVLTKGNADVILITDLSGSMKCRMGQWGCPPVGNSIPGCKDSDLEDPNSRRLGIAGCLDSQINDIIMNESLPAGNRLWLSDFSDNANPFYSNDLSEIKHDNIEQEIKDRYKSKSQNEIHGGTCLACSINQAYQILDAYSNESRKKYVVVMTDGIPTYCTGGYYDGFQWRCDEDSTGTTAQWPAWWQSISCTGDESDCATNDCLAPANNAINSAQRLHNDLNATIFAVGMGPMTDCSMANYTLSNIAEKGNGTFLISQNASELMLFYKEIATHIIDSTELSSQRLITKGNLTPSILYGDSFIEYNYSSTKHKTKHGEVPIYFEEQGFDSCSKELYIPKQLEVIDAKITSYSDEFWTYSLHVQNSDGTFDIFNLSKYSHDFSRLGDPYSISIPPEILKSGEINKFKLRVGNNPDNSTNCSENNSIIYTGLMDILNASTPYSTVLPKAEGCLWRIENIMGKIMQVKVPESYTGTEICNYTNESHSLKNIDTDDSYNVAMYNFLDYADYNNNGRIFIDFNEEDLNVNMKIIKNVPYLWGPATAEVSIWK
ncbi:MAG: hypothetical protein ACQESF_03045 [Nanobdellota archaeon]